MTPAEDSLDRALCNFCNGASDPYEPVSRWDETTWRAFGDLCRAYNDWYVEIKAREVSSPEEGEGRRGKRGEPDEQVKLRTKPCSADTPSKARPLQSGAPAGIVAGQRGAGVASGPLTPAERQKRYREKLGDEYRKRNRDRMREVRRK